MQKNTGFACELIFFGMIFLSPKTHTRGQELIVQPCDDESKGKDPEGWLGVEPKHLLLS